MLSAKQPVVKKNCMEQKGDQIMVGPAEKREYIADGSGFLSRNDKIQAPYQTLWENKGPGLLLSNLVDAIKTIKIHYFCPRFNKVMDKFLFRVIHGINLGNGPEFGI